MRANRDLGHGYFCVAVEAEGLSATFRPGQFFMLRVENGSDPLLPRAYSIYRMARSRRGRGARVDLLYKVVGRGTAQLAGLRAGAAVDLLGPLGNAFTVPPGTRELLLVAGGIGVPPVVALAEALAASRRNGRSGRSQRPAIVAFLGGRSKPDILCAADFRRAGARAGVATEDGSAGERGLVTDLLERHLEGGSPAGRAIYACGPPGMLRRIAELAAAHEVPGQLSMEAPMGCGIGICMGCAIPVRWHEADGREAVRYRLCCTDGPVFEADEVVW
ncbi:MAG: dihydroorotate dehydrogenase electron transfer subunit [candidate division NC10 bacterium]|nr:dihydroorotate dehydrogenase electron transfer subunit [candidate division NC10 bacterium]